MNNRTLALASIIIAIIFAGTIAGTMVYYNGVVNGKNSQITSLNSRIANQSLEIANLTSQVANLQSQITNLTTANLVAEITVTEVTDGYNFGGHVPHNHLVVSGSVRNVGEGTAYDAGLQVIAYSSDGTLEINMTVPLLPNAIYPTDNSTADFVGSHIGVSSQILGHLDGNSSAYITEIDIYHEGTVTNWAAIPVWKNTS